MKADFIKLLCENEIKSTEMALCVESISDEIQGMIEKLNNIKIKDIAELVKKMKYDNRVEEAEGFNQSLTEKLDQAINSLTEIKGSIDNEVVSLFNGESLDSGASFDSDDGIDDLDNFDDSDLASDFGDVSDEEGL